jgi:hypothetical protein
MCRDDEVASQPRRNSNKSARRKPSGDRQSQEPLFASLHKVAVVSSQREYRLEVAARVLAMMARMDCIFTEDHVERRPHRPAGEQLEPGVDSGGIRRRQY